MSWYAYRNDRACDLYSQMVYRNLMTGNWSYDVHTGGYSTSSRSGLSSSSTVSNCVDYSTFASKSAAAIEREGRAKNHMKQLVELVQQDPQYHPNGLSSLYAQVFQFDLLTPSVHLTAACWSSFTKHVKEEYPGWFVKRRVATYEERRAHKVKRQGKVYFVTAHYRPSTDPKNSQSAYGLPLAERKANIFDTHAQYRPSTDPKNFRSSHGLPLGERKANIFDTHGQNDENRAPSNKKQKVAHFTGDANIVKTP